MTEPRERIENPPPLGHPWDPSSEDPEERGLVPWSVQPCGCALRVDGEAVLCEEHLDELNRPLPEEGRREEPRCVCDGARYGPQERPFLVDPSCRWHGDRVTEACAMCLGSGRVAIGPWGVSPPKKTCPECSGRKRVPVGHRYDNPTVQPERSTR